MPSTRLEDRSGFARENSSESARSRVFCENHSGSRPMNTRISYQYRDALNAKACRTDVIRGAFGIEDVIPFVSPDRLFVPKEVGLSELQPILIEFPGNGDHIWHEFLEAKPTESEPTVAMDATDFLGRFRIAHLHGWNVKEAEKRLRSSMKKAS
jgi:hypothetical protein